MAQSEIKLLDPTTLEESETGIPYLVERINNAVIISPYHETPPPEIPIGPTPEQQELESLRARIADLEMALTELMTGGGI